MPNNYRYVRSSRLIVNHRRRRRHTFQRKPPSANFYIPLYPPFPAFENRARNFLHTEYIVCCLGLTPTNVAALIAAAKRLACERPPRGKIVLFARRVTPSATFADTNRPLSVSQFARSACNHEIIRDSAKCTRGRVR